MKYVRGLESFVLEFIAKGLDTSLLFEVDMCDDCRYWLGIAMEEGCKDPAARLKELTKTCACGGFQGPMVEKQVDIDIDFSELGVE